MSDASVSAMARMRDVVIVGGGCYGTFYATQLAKAKQRGKASYRTVVIVDRDERCRARLELQEAPDRLFVVDEWDTFFDRFLGTGLAPRSGEERDFVVPSPHMPHLMFEWLVRRARARFQDRQFEVVGVPGDLTLPYDRSAPDLTRYVSFADWICPTHCIEPQICPAIGQPRTWEMSETLRGLAERLRAAGEPVQGPALFVCQHHVYGVGTFAVEEVLEGERIVAEAARTPDVALVLVGTVSSCHGAVNLLKIGVPHPS